MEFRSNFFLFSFSKFEASQNSTLRIGKSSLKKRNRKFRNLWTTSLREREGGKKRIENRIGGRRVIRQGQREAEITRAVCGQHFWPPNAEVRIELSPSARTAAAACGTTTCRIFVRNNCGRLVTTLGQPAFYGRHSKATRFVAYFYRFMLYQFNCSRFV